MHASDHSITNVHSKLKPLPTVHQLYKSTPGGGSSFDFVASHRFFQSISKGMNTIIVEELVNAITKK